MTTRERQLAALCEEMVDEIEGLWLIINKLNAADWTDAPKNYRLRLDRLTKRKGKK